MPKKKEITLEDVARMTQEGFEAVGAELHQVRKEVAGQIRESEERLLQAISGVEVRRPEFEALQHDVEDLSGRVGALEENR